MHPVGGIGRYARALVKVTLTDQELARLDEIRPSGTTRPAFLRSLFRSRHARRGGDQDQGLASSPALPETAGSPPPSPRSGPSARKPRPTTSSTISSEAPGGSSSTASVDSSRRSSA